jgi:3-oxoacyl-[acyl-carrier protein] reductase
MTINLEGKVALVTGAARGLGEAFAHRLAASGARVIYSDIDFEGVQQSSAKSPSGVPLQLDVSSVPQVETAMAWVEQKFGRLDILVNNAGINSGLEHRVNIDRFAPEEWDRILKVDLDGVFLVSRLAARMMVRQKSGRIINIASALGVVPARLQCAFVAAKSAVVGLTRAMAIELGPSNIAVNCVAPGTMTGISLYQAGSPAQAQGRRLLQHVPLGRPGTLDEIAGAVLYFSAPESAYVTGQILAIDGGWTSGSFFR